MELTELVRLQREFDSRHSSTFSWSQPISAVDPAPLSHNVLALAGEVGELANIVKKLERGDLSFEEVYQHLPGELADILIYVLKLSYQSGVDLESAFLAKLADNEKRFSAALTQPGDRGASSWGHGPDLAKWRGLSADALLGEVTKWSQLGKTSSTVLRRLAAIFHKSHVTTGTSNHLLAASLLAVLRAQCAETENRELRERALRRVYSVAQWVGVSEDELSRLSIHDDEVLRALRPYDGSA